MAHVIVQNTREGDAPVPPSRRDDGTYYAYGLYFDGGRSIAWADDFEDMIEVLSPGYLNKNDHERLIARITVGLRAQQMVQAQVYATADEDDLTALTPEQDALINGTRQDRPVIEEWTSEIPLVLLTTAYQPHTETPAPVSSYGPYLDVPNIWWIDPVDEESLMMGLHSTGWVKVVETIQPGEGELLPQE